MKDKMVAVLIMMLILSGLAQAQQTSRSSEIAGRAVIKDVDKQLDAYREQQQDLQSKKKDFIAFRESFLRNRCSLEQWSSTEKCQEPYTGIRFYYMQWIETANERLSLASNLLGQKVALGKISREEYDQQLRNINALTEELSILLGRLKNVSGPELVPISKQLNTLYTKSDGIRKVLSATKKYSREIDLTRILAQVEQLRKRLESLVNEADIPESNYQAAQDILEQLRADVVEMRRAVESNDIIEVRKTLTHIKNKVSMIKESIEKIEGREFFKKQALQREKTQEEQL